MLYINKRVAVAALFLMEQMGRVSSTRDSIKPHFLIQLLGFFRRLFFYKLPSYMNKGSFQFLAESCLVNIFISLNKFSIIALCLDFSETKQLQE